MKINDEEFMRGTHKYYLSMRNISFVIYDTNFTQLCFEFNNEQLKMMR